MYMTLPLNKFIFNCEFLFYCNCRIQYFKMGCRLNIFTRSCFSNRWWVLVLQKKERIQGNFFDYLICLNLFIFCLSNKIKYIFLIFTLHNILAVFYIHFYIQFILTFYIYLHTKLDQGNMKQVKV